MVKVLITGYDNINGTIDRDYYNALCNHSSVSGGDEWSIQTTNGVVKVHVDVDDEGEAFYEDYDHVVFVYPVKEPLSLITFLPGLKRAHDEGVCVYTMGLYDGEPRDLDAFFVDNIAHKDVGTSLLTYLVRDSTGDHDLVLAPKPVPIPVQVPTPSIDVDEDIQRKLVELLTLLLTYKK